MSSGNESHAGTFAPIVQALERQLADLDQIGAHIAAAHIDAAINQLRLDQLNSESA